MLVQVTYDMQIQLPRDYPYSPPDFIMLTPNGRFREGAKICTSFSSFHPETWSPAYTLTTLLLSFISFFTDEDSPAQGMVHMSVEQRKRLAVESVAWGAKSHHCKNLKIFQHLQPGLQTEQSLEYAISKLRGVHEVGHGFSGQTTKRKRFAPGNMITHPSQPAPQQTGNVPVDVSECSQHFSDKQSCVPMHAIVDLTDGPTMGQHGDHGSIKVAKAAVRETESLNGQETPLNKASLSKVATQVVDLT